MPGELVLQIEKIAGATAPLGSHFVNGSFTAVA